MREYKECYVAFIDVLGFKELISSQDCETIYQVFKELHMHSHGNLNFNGVDILAYKDIQHRILSDSVILFIDANIKDSFAALLDVCRKLQESLANREKPILMRGGIVKGLLFCEENTIFGEGLTNAYLLESRLAKYPRIIFSGETFEEGKKNAYYMFPFLEGIGPDLCCDEDNLFFVNYLPHLKGSIEETKEYSDRLYSLCNEMLNKTIDSNLREKYLWLKKKVDISVSQMSQVKELYDKELEVQRERKTNEYNQRFKVFAKTNKDE